MGGNIFSIVIAIIAVFGVIGILMFFLGRKGGSKGEKQGKTEGQLIKEATRRLAKNPDDPNGLLPLGEIYFTKELWEKAYPVYQSLARISLTTDRVDKLQVTLRTGICAAKLGNFAEGIKFLVDAYKLDPHSFEVNNYLGYTYLKMQQYDKAIPCLKKALMIQPTAEGVYLSLGQCLYAQKHYRESLPYFKKALTADPGNKETLFSMADALAEDGQGDKALKIFTHLRPDPVFGPRACLRAGIYHFNQKDRDSAIQDLKIGLKHQNIPQEISIELQYRLAICYLETNKLQDGLGLLRTVRSQNPNYKDVNALVARYAELSQNTNLQLYLSGPVSDFVTLCRKIVNSFYKGAFVKILDINVGSVYTDIYAEINTARMEDTEVFRFFRTTSVTGELYIREFHDGLHDKKAEKGVCFTAGLFSDETHKYIEGRPIDLVEKTQLTKLLKGIS